MPKNTSHQTQSNWPLNEECEWLHSVENVICNTSLQCLNGPRGTHTTGGGNKWIATRSLNPGKFAGIIIFRNHLTFYLPSKSPMRWGAAIAHWICLRIKSCHPGVRVPSTPSMLLSFIVKFVLFLSLYCEKEPYKQKEAGFGQKGALIGRNER